MSSRSLTSLRPVEVTCGEYTAHAATNPYPLNFPKPLVIFVALGMIGDVRGLSLNSSNFTDCDAWPH